MIGRNKELEIIKGCMESNRSRLIVVYGRRRVGKTFLVREAFNYKFTFQHAGIANTAKNIQLEEWGKSLQKHGLKIKNSPNLGLFYFIIFCIKRDN